MLSIDRKLVADHHHHHRQGFISEGMCAANLPKASSEAIAFMCGPPAMIKFACIPSLEKMGYSKEDYFSF